MSDINIMLKELLLKKLDDDYLRIRHRFMGMGKEEIINNACVIVAFDMIHASIYDMVEDDRISSDTMRILLAYSNILDIFAGRYQRGFILDWENVINEVSNNVLNFLDNTTASKSYIEPMRIFHDTEHDTLITEIELRNEFYDMQQEYPGLFDYSFEQYIKNCTDKNGTLEEV